MPELPPDPSGDENSDEVQGETGADAPTPPDVEPVDPAGAPSPGTRPSGTPPFGTPPSGTPPFGTPGHGGVSPPWNPSSGTPPPWNPSSGTPPWAAGGWVPGGPTWVAPAPWYYGFGPGWQGAPQQQPPATATPDHRRPRPWVIVGVALAALAMVGAGLGIGFGVWGGGTSAVARRAPIGQFPGFSPAPQVGRGSGFLGVEVETAGLTTGTSPTSVPAAPSGARVVRVISSSPAAKAGIVAGDTITELDTRSVASALALELDVTRLSPGQRAKVGWVTSTGKHESATVTLAKRPAEGSAG